MKSKRIRNLFDKRMVRNPFHGFETVCKFNEPVNICDAN